MADKTEQTKDAQSTEKESQEKPFESMSLEEMEATLSKDTAELETENEASEDSENQEVDSEEQSEQATEGEAEVEESKSESETKVEDKQVGKSLEDRFAELEKNYKELQGEFTRRSQKLRDLEREIEEPVKKVDSKEQKDSEKKLRKLDQLRAKSPEAAELFEEMREELREELRKEYEPIKDQVTFRTKQQNVDAWKKHSEEFKSSELGELETDLVSIYNENPSEWQRYLLESPDAFVALKKELITRHWDKVKAILSRNTKTKNDEVSSGKKKDLQNATVNTKSKVTSKVASTLDAKEFRKLSLEEMEKRLPSSD